MMKKLIALFMTLCLLCSLAGCGGRNVVSLPDDDDDDSSSSTSRSESSRASSVPEPEEDEPEEPAEPDGAAQSGDLLGSWNGSIYANEALGISYTLPAGWVYASDEELLGMMDIALDSGILSDRTQLVVELGKSRIVYGMVAQDPVSGNNIQVMFESLEGMSNQDAITEEVYAASAASQQEQMLNASADASVSIGETYRARLGGQDCLVLPLTLTMSGVTANEWFYLRRVGDRMSMVIFTSMNGQDPDGMTGGVSSFGPLGSASGSTGTSGTSGALTATGDIGRTFSTMFFDYTVVSVESPAAYDGYTAESGNKLLVVRVRVKNDFGSTLPMYDTDFPLFWGNGDYEYSWAVDAFNGNMMPLEWELADGQEATWDMLFEVPADRMDFSLSYLEEYTDRYGSEQTGEWYDAQFSLLGSSAA